ncbi:MAG: DinB family protein [Phototrophicaceae bacterium]
MRHIQKPLEGEYDPYTIMYIKLVPDDGLVLQHLVDNFERVKAAIMPLSEAQLTTPHQDGEWTIKEILVHIMDDERIFAYRALRAARADQTPYRDLNKMIILCHPKPMTAP